MSEIRDFLTNATKLQVAARITRLPPADIPIVPKHAAINLGVTVCAAIGLLVSNILYSSGANIGLSLSIITAIISVLLIGVFGFLVNLLSPSGENFVETEGSGGLPTTNKWATYLLVSFNLTILVFIFVNQTLAAFGVVLQQSIIDKLDIDGGRALLIMTLASSVFAILIILGKCLWFRQIKPGRGPKVFIAFCVGAILDGVIFRYMAFPF